VGDGNDVDILVRMIGGEVKHGWHTQVK